MRQLLSNLVGILSSLGLWFGSLRQSQCVFARLAQEADAVAAQLAGAASAPEPIDLAALAQRLREVAQATEQAATQSSVELEQIRDGMLRATALAAAMTGDVVRGGVTRGSGPEAGPEPPSAPDPLEGTLRETIQQARQREEATLRNGPRAVTDSSCFRADEVAAGQRGRTVVVGGAQGPARRPAPPGAPGRGQLAANIASTSTAASPGRDGTPIVERA